MKGKVNSLCMMDNYNIRRDDIFSKSYYMLNFGHQDTRALLQRAFVVISFLM